MALSDLRNTKRNCIAYSSKAQFSQIECSYIFGQDNKNLLTFLNLVFQVLWTLLSI